MKSETESSVLSRILPKFHIYILTIILCSVLLRISIFLDSNNETQYQLFLPQRHSDTTPNSSSELEPGSDVYTIFQQADTYLFPNDNRSFSMEDTSTITPTDKIIFIWMENQEVLQSTGKRIFAPCPKNQCFLTTNLQHYNQSSAVLFFPAGMLCNSPKDPAPPRRVSSKQMFVFVMGESPINGLGCGFTSGENFFNWTMTYRLDSDIRAHYTYKVPLEEKRRNFAEGKTGLVVWVVSHCETDSFREKYVEELRKIIPVDVYGKCGNLSCESNKFCLSLLKNYKFYLSFENSLCKDYITEKLIKTLEQETVPIVYGDGNYKLLLPPKSYIHLYDYPYPRKLANYLLQLDRNDALYNEFMNWRYHKKFIQSRGQYAAKLNGFCGLCQKLHSPLSSKKRYESIFRWWVYNNTPYKYRQEMCRNGGWFLQKMRDSLNKTNDG